MKNNNRKQELLDIAYNMFLSKGYENTSVDEIIEKANVAKGTFYYYFESKEQILEEVVNLMVENGTIKANDILKTNISIPEKIIGIILAFSPNEKEITIRDTLNSNANIILHNKLNDELIERMTPMLKEIAEEGNKMGIFSCDNISERIKSILILSNKLFNDDNNFTKNDIEVFIDIVEKTLGAKTGTMSFINKIIER